LVREQAERALALLEEAKSKHVAADAAMYGAVVRCCARSARPVDAEATAAAATAAGVSLSVATHNTLMGMYLRAPSEGHRAKAAAVYARLKASGLSADASTCATFMACCEKDARWAEAKAAFEEMKASGVEAPAAACAVYETALARLAGDPPAAAEAKAAAKAAAATGEKKAEKAKESKKATQLRVSAKEFVPGGK
jgi:pentatricopeptide repeat protein